MANKNPNKIPILFECVTCHYNTCNKKDYSKHLQTQKHNRLTNANDLSPQNPQTMFFTCVCNKTYNHMSSLCKHKKKCSKLMETSIYTEKETKEDNTTIISNDIILELVKQNQEFQKLIIEQNQKIMELSKNSSITNNTTNNKFNLQFFLNEKCKDALNLMDFVNDLQIKLTDLENVGRLG